MTTNDLGAGASHRRGRSVAGRCDRNARGLRALERAVSRIRLTAPNTPTADHRRPPGSRAAERPRLGMIVALSASHMLNDIMQSLAPALYPVFRRIWV